jgi:probable O-glycosylation ligase (exosortase A-associated)
MDRALGAAAPWWQPSRPAARAVVRTEPARDALAFGALAAFTIILLVSPQAWFPVIKSLRIALLAALLAAAAHLGYRFTHRGRVPVFRLELGLASALVLWAAVTIPFSIWPGGSWDQLTDHLIKAVVFFWLIGAIVSTLPRLTTFAWVLSLCAIPLAVTALDNYRTGEYVTLATSAVQRIAGYTGGSGLAGNPNDLALMLNLLIPIAGALLAVARSPGQRLAAATTLLVSIAAVVATFSRAGFITLAAIGLLSIVALIRRRAPAAALALLLAAATVPLLMPERYFDRVATIANIEADPTGSAQGRWKDFQVAAAYIADHPIVGAGLGQDLLALNEARGHATWRSVHNAFLQSAVDLGLPGLALLCSMLWVSLRTAGQVRRSAADDPERHDLAMLAQGVQISLIAFTVAALFHPIAYQFYFFCLAGLAVALRSAGCADASARP